MKPIRMGVIDAGRMGRNALLLATQIRDQIRQQLIPVTTSYLSPFVFKQYA